MRTAQDTTSRTGASGPVGGARDSAVASMPPVPLGSICVRDRLVTLPMEDCRTDRPAESAFCPRDDPEASGDVLLARLPPGVAFPAAVAGREGTAGLPLVPATLSASGPLFLADCRDLEAAGSPGAVPSRPVLDVVLPASVGSARVFAVRLSTNSARTEPAVPVEGAGAVVPHPAGTAFGDPPVDTGSDAVLPGVVAESTGSWLAPGADARPGASRFSVDPSTTSSCAFSIDPKAGPYPVLMPPMECICLPAGKPPASSGYRQDPSEDSPLF